MAAASNMHTGFPPSGMAGDVTQHASTCMISKQVAQLRMQQLCLGNLQLEEAEGCTVILSNLGLCTIPPKLLLSVYWCGVVWCGVEWCGVVW